MNAISFCMELGLDMKKNDGSVAKAVCGVSGMAFPPGQGLLLQGWKLALTQMANREGID